MTAEERLEVLLGDLYYNLQLLQESTVADKKERAAVMIYDFYKENKEKHKIESIKALVEKIDKLNEKQKGERTDIESLYYEEEPGDR